MNKFEDAKTIFFKEMQSKSSGFYFRNGCNHCIGVATIGMMIAQKRNLDKDLIGIAGLFHDIHTYTKMNSFNHAHFSSIQAKKLLIDLLSEEDINIICTAIKNHSNKENIDDEYSECLKDADLIHHQLSNLETKQSHLFRLETLKSEGYIT